MTNTELKLQYVERTWDIEFQDCIEQALENDYVLNSALYTNEKFKQIQMTLFLLPEITPTELIEMLHEEFQNA